MLSTLHPPQFGLGAAGPRHCAGHEWESDCEGAGRRHAVLKSFWLCKARREVRDGAGAQEETIFASHRQCFEKGRHCFQALPVSHLSLSRMQSYSCRALLLHASGLADLCNVASSALRGPNSGLSVLLVLLTVYFACPHGRSDAERKRLVAALRGRVKKAAVAGVCVL